jgi:hypothetical protein
MKKKKKTERGKVTLSGGGYIGSLWHSHAYAHTKELEEKKRVCESYNRYLIINMEKGKREQQPRGLG